MLNCDITEMNYFDQEEKEYVKVYGLKFYHIENRSIYIKVIDNMFCQREEAMRAMNLINASNISEVHIDDVVENLLLCII